MSAPDDTTSRVRRKRMEIFAFLFLTAVVMPVLAVGTVGSYGLGVWIYQMFAGPPGPPLAALTSQRKTAHHGPIAHSTAAH